MSTDGNVMDSDNGDNLIVNFETMFTLFSSIWINENIYLRSLQTIKTDRDRMAEILPTIFEKMDYLDDGFVDGWVATFHPFAPQ